MNANTQRRGANMDNYEIIDAGADDGTVLIKEIHADGSATTMCVPKELALNGHPEYDG